MDLIVKVLEKIQDNAENVETAQLERGKLPYIARRIAKKYKDSFEISLYADDTTTVTTSGDEDFFVTYNQIIIDTIEAWTNENKLTGQVWVIQILCDRAKNGFQKFCREIFPMHMDTWFS